MDYKKEETNKLRNKSSASEDEKMKEPIRGVVSDKGGSYLEGKMHAQMQDLSVDRNYLEYRFFNQDEQRFNI